jgi:uncharacterized protein (DUF2237 family)
MMTHYSLLTNTLMSDANNVLGGKLEVCCTSPMTGFYRNGTCDTGPDDSGIHVVCAEVTEEFLSFTKARGNDLSTPSSTRSFPGLNPGDRWCLCASRWKEALDAGVAPPVFLSATHASVLEYVSLEDLRKNALDIG